MKRTLLDTNILIDWMNEGLHEAVVAGPGRMRILSAVVLMELRAGASTRGATRAVDQLVRAYHSAQRVVVPTPSNYDEAGRVLHRLRRRSREVRRASLVNDVLIALTARSLGATVVTRDASAFEVIRSVCDFSLELVG